MFGRRETEYSSTKGHCSAVFLFKRDFQKYRDFSTSQEIHSNSQSLQNGTRHVTRNLKELRMEMETHFTRKNPSLQKRVPSFRNTNRKFFAVSHLFFQMSIYFLQFTIQFKPRLSKKKKKVHLTIRDNRQFTYHSSFQIPLNFLIVLRNAFMLDEITLANLGLEFLFVSFQLSFLHKIIFVEGLE